MIMNNLLKHHWNVRTKSPFDKKIEIMILKVCKTVNKLNPSCIHDVFT